MSFKSNSSNGTSNERTDVNVNTEVLKKEEKEDDHLLLYITLFYLLGTVCFVPHSFYVTANKYWMYKFRDPDQHFNESDIGNKTYLQQNFTSNANISGNVGQIVFMFLTIFLRDKISVHFRLIGSMNVLLLLFATTIAFIYIDTDSWQFGFFVIALIVCGLVHGCAGVLLVSIFQMATKFPPRCLAAQFAGQSVCGILAAAIQVLSLTVTSSVKVTAALYYFIAFGTIALVMIIYIVALEKSEAFRNRLYKADDVPSEKTERPKIELALIKGIFEKLWMIILALSLSVGISGLLHPGLTALIESSGKGTNAWSDTYFVPVSVFFLHNVLEIVGREVSNHVPMMKNKYIMLATSLLRFPLFPLILLCNIQPRKHLPVVFHEDAYFVVFMMLLAFTGGYLINVTILTVPKYTKPEERTLANLLVVLIMIVLVPIFSICNGVLVNLI